MNSLNRPSNLLIKFFLPGYYLFYSRLLRKSERISWLIVFPMVVLLASLLVEPADGLSILAVFSISFLAWLSVYEIGYMENDAFTIDLEAQPTLRIPKGESDWIKANFHKIIGTRSLIFLLLTYILWHFFTDNFSLTYFFSIVGLTRLVFYFHNRLRSRWNILTYLLLSLGKYLFLALILFQLNFPLLLLALVFAFPLPRTLEHACKVKYGLKPIKLLIGEFDLFRVRYYGIGVLVFGTLVWGFPEEGWLIPLAVFVYFFLFRTFGWAMVKFGNYNRSEFEVHQWDKK